MNKYVIFLAALLTGTVAVAQKTQFKYAFQHNNAHVAKIRVDQQAATTESVYKALAEVSNVDVVLKMEEDDMYMLTFSTMAENSSDQVREALKAVGAELDLRTVYILDKALASSRYDKADKLQLPSQNYISSIEFDQDMKVSGTKSVLQQLDEPVPVTFTAGNVHQVNVQIAENITFPVHGKAWIDLNGDGEFGLSEAVGVWNGSKDIQFRIPQQACNGWTKMKFTQAEGDAVLYDQPYFLSHAMEMMVNIQGGSCNPDYFKTAANNQDCEDAQPLCQEDYEQTTSPPGEGNDNQELSDISTSCFGISGSSGSYEQNSVWYTFTTPNTGDLSFTITPNDPDDDYDWVVFDITGFDCDDIATNPNLEVSCNWSGDPGPTGPNGQGTGTSEGAGGPPFNRTIPVSAGNTYVILVNNWSLSTNGYSIDYGQSTADVYATDLNTVDSSICKGDSVLLRALYTGATFGNETYSWSPDSLVKDTAGKNTFTVPLTADTTIFYVSLNLGACDFTDSLIVYTYEALSDFNTEYDSILSPVEVEFENLSADNTVRYAWDFGNGLVSDDKTPDNQFYEEPGTYTVTLVTENELGCLDTSYTEIVVPFFDIPNVITPNDDGINDVFIITGLKENTNLIIYNRWGKKVQEVLGFNNDWDGGDLSDGAYYYVAQQQDGTVIEDFKGWLQIMR